MICFHVTQYRGLIFGFCVSIYNFGINLVLLVSKNLSFNPHAFVVLISAAVWAKLLLCSELCAWKDEPRWRVVLRKSAKHNCSFLENRKKILIFSQKTYQQKVSYALSSSRGNVSAHDK